MIVATTELALLMTETVFAPSFVTYMSPVIGEYAAPYGFVPTDTVATTLFAELITETLFVL